MLLLLMKRKFLLILQSILVFPAVAYPDFSVRGEGGGSQEKGKQTLGGGASNAGEILKIYAKFFM